MQSHVFFEAFWQAVLDRRLRGSLNKEDAVRYAFFHALTTTVGIQQADIHLESQHTGLEGRKEIDLLVPPLQGQAGLLTEFKFDRQQEAGNVNRTHRVGAVFKDLYRLSRYDPQGSWIRLFVYITEGEMARHFRSTRLGLSGFFDGPLDTTLDGLFTLGSVATIQTHIAGLQSQARVRQVFRQDQGELYLRLYQVGPP
jgi:hypothetical protein